jgi:hypothetical protein
MPVATAPSLDWEHAVIAYAILVIAAFLVTWVVTDRLHMRRTRYVAILALLALTLLGAELAWSGTSFVDLVVPRWGLGVLGGLLAALGMAPLVRRASADRSQREMSIVKQYLWEAGVYGIAEALILAALPVLVVWQGAQALGWTQSEWTRIGAGAMAILGALIVIAAHHLGYREFRTRAARPKLGGALLACGAQALAFLLTGNLLAPIVAHVLLHAQMISRRIELPPAEGIERQNGRGTAIVHWMGRPSWDRSEDENESAPRDVGFAEWRA